ncbi:caspase, EACC1-associated type [Kribbella shirazensis]|uniref:YVTN family beta-propeller protein n=1 Tax=Kribbella shirazensis TaxID=1105143 RepID=A0A7X5VBQ1_9ACTN|nr:caspase family protein [Kribbella shirazensis]NIK58255.1 YVTN family beta-propeller protein [Kribbella shirazensis]
MRRALLVATYEYEDTGLRRLAAPERDVEALAEVLEDQAVAGFDVQVLMNKPTHEVGKAIADFFAAGERDDLMLLYFSGHGLKDDNGRLYLAMKNTARDSLRFTALSSDLVRDTVSESRPRQTVLILDCCYSGAYAAEQFAKSDSAVHTKEAFGGRGRIVLTASDSTQYAFEGTESVFTHHLVEGLRTGAADLDADGDITTEELYDYTYNAVTAEQPNQRPRQFAEVEGRTVVASNARWALPDHLAGAVNSPITEIRQTAIAPLGQLLQANNELVRRTAREQLELLRDDDSRSIAAMAQAYLDNPPPPVRPQPTTTPTPRRATGPTFSAAARASARRWRGRVSLPELDWPIVGLAAVAAVAQIVCAVIAAPRVWQTIVVAALAVAAVPVVVRLRTNASTFAAGLAGPALLATVQATGWILHEFSRSLQPLPATWYLIGSVAWVAAGVVGLLRLRRISPVRSAPHRLLLVLGAVAAILVLLILLYVDRHARVHPLWVTVLYVLTAEIAIAGPLIQLNRQFLAGWVVSGFALLFGFLRFQRDTDLPQLAAIALLAVWLVLGVATVLPLRTGRPLGLRVTAAALLAPPVLGVVGVAVVPPAPRPPLAVGLAISPDDRFLYATDTQNGRVMRFSTTTQERVGEPLEVGEFPSNLIVEPDGSRLYVANSKSNSVSVIDAASWTVVGRPIAVAPGPTTFALNTATDRLFVLSQTAATITEINTETLTTVGGPLAAGTTPTDVAVDDSGRLYVSSRDTDTVAVLDARSRQAVRSPIAVGDAPGDLISGPDGALYVVGKASYAVINTKVELSKPTKNAVPGDLKDGAVSNDGRFLCLFGRSGKEDTVQVIDTGSRKVVGSLNANLGLPARIAVSPDGQRIYLSRFFEPGIAVLDSSGPRQVGIIDTDH